MYLHYKIHISRKDRVDLAYFRMGLKERAPLLKQFLTAQESKIGEVSLLSICYVLVEIVIVHSGRTNKEKRRWQTFYRTSISGRRAKRRSSFTRMCSVVTPRCSWMASALYTWTSRPAVFTLWAAASKAIRLGWSAVTVTVWCSIVTARNSCEISTPGWWTVAKRCSHRSTAAGVPSSPIAPTSSVSPG